jgi:hypothetical protein
LSAPKKNVLPYEEPPKKAAKSFAQADPVGEDGFYNNPTYKRSGGEAGSQSRSTNVRGTSSFV